MLELGLGLGANARDGNFRGSMCPEGGNTLHILRLNTCDSRPFHGANEDMFHCLQGLMAGFRD